LNIKDLREMELSREYVAAAAAEDTVSVWLNASRMCHESRTRSIPCVFRTNSWVKKRKLSDVLQIILTIVIYRRTTLCWRGISRPACIVSKR